MKLCKNGTKECILSQLLFNVYGVYLQNNLSQRFYRIFLILRNKK